MTARVLILAPRGRDAAIAADLFATNKIHSHVCADVAMLTTELNSDAGAVLLTEESLHDDMSGLAKWIAGQPSWADMPFIVLANGAKSPRSLEATHRLAELGNVVLLERPLHVEAMLGAVRSALKARDRQYDLRDTADVLERAVVQRTVELEAARDSLEFALDAAGMGSWDIDLETGEARRSLRHDQIFGYDQSLPDWDVETFLKHVSPAQRDDVAQAFVVAQQSGSLDVECSIEGVDGRVRWIVAKGQVRYNDEGDPVRMTGVVSDVTDRKDAEDQLAQAQKMDAIGQLTGGVAHDFNNLLTPIVGNLDLVRRRHKNDERTQRMIGSALQAAERAATLTQRLLSFARRQSLQPRAVDVGTLINGIVDLVRRTLGPSVIVKLEIPRHLPSALIDPNQLELALLNLAINARDAMSGGGRLTITVSEVAVDDRNLLGLKAGRYICIVTADNGSGMDRSTLTRATEPFFSTKGVGKGTGLGLSMVHGLAAQSGGTFNLLSEAGTGTQAELWLPATDEVGRTLVEQREEPAPANRTATIMLVDDEELVRSAAADMLRDIGYTVIEMGSGSQALTALRSGVETHALVSDYLMPGMNGGQLIQELRSLGIMIPALLVTGYAAAGKDVPADVNLLAKPFRQVDLAAQIDVLLRSPRRLVARLQAVD